MSFDPKIEHLRKQKIVVSTLCDDSWHREVYLSCTRQKKEAAYKKNLGEKTKALKVRHMKIVSEVAMCSVTFIPTN